jgi:hypothetical protein
MPEPATDANTERQSVRRCEWWCKADVVTDNLTRYFWTGERLTTLGVIAAGVPSLMLGLAVVELWGVWGLAALFALFAVVVPLLAARSSRSR